MQLGAGEAGTEYNFGERGLIAAKISLRMMFASAPVEYAYIVQMNAAPSVNLAPSTSSANYSGKACRRAERRLAITAADATVTDADSPMLASMKITLTNPLDGDSEKLAATLTGTSITSSYAGGVLTLSGAATAADYQKVLRTVTYVDTAATPQLATRKINVVANDGVVDSLLATSLLILAQ